MSRTCDDKEDRIIAEKQFLKHNQFDSAVEEAKHRVTVITPAGHPPDP
jgi:hypothetical protein